MNWYDRISHAFENAPVLPLTLTSRYVLFSDCHRGCGNINDNFLKNRNLYYAALEHYYNEQFTYIELGDGDELWENHSYSRIIDIHREVFLLLSKYRQENRLYMLYGNHDHCKKSGRYCVKYCCTLGITFHEGLILQDTLSKKELYLTHGHQPDFLNSTLAPLAGFLVRYLWKPLEHLGVQDPTSAARNYTRKQKTEKRLTEWACNEGRILITGHTHRPMLGTDASPYFNTGSCVHPESITCIEIQNSKLTLVKWALRTRTDMTLYVAREVLGEVSV